MAESKKGDKGKKKDAAKVKKKVAATISLHLSEYSKAEAKAAKKLAGKGPFKLAAMTPKRKCCRSGVRCLRCPVVLYKFNREIRDGGINHAALLLAAAKARIR